MPLTCHMGAKQSPAVDTALRERIADNLHAFMQAPGSLYTSAHALSVATKGRVSAQTIRNLLLPEQRVLAAGRQAGYPRLDTLSEVLMPLRREVWELLHPDINIVSENGLPRVPRRDRFCRYMD